jgi:hypothetical protein
MLYKEIISFSDNTQNLKIQNGKFFIVEADGL